MVHYLLPLKLNSFGWTDDVFRSRNSVVFCGAVAHCRNIVGFGEWIESFLIQERRLTTGRRIAIGTVRVGCHELVHGFQAAVFFKTSFIVRQFELNFAGQQWRCGVAQQLQVDWKYFTWMKEMQSKKNQPTWSLIDLCNSIDAAIVATRTFTHAHTHTHTHRQEIKDTPIGKKKKKDVEI